MVPPWIIKGEGLRGVPLDMKGEGDVVSPLDHQEGEVTWFLPWIIKGEGFAKVSPTRSRNIAV